MAQQDGWINVIEDLVRTCRDSQQAFRQACENAQDPELRSLLLDEMEERGHFAGELENRIAQQDPARQAQSLRSSSETRSDRRSRTGLKNVVGAGDQAILNSLAAMDEFARGRYEKALQQGLPQEVEAMVREQLQSIMASDDLLKSMRARARAA